MRAIRMSGSVGASGEQSPGATRLTSATYGGGWRCPGRGNWSLTSLQQRLVKIGGRLIKHARYYWLLLAESHLTRRLFGGMLGKVAALPSSAG